jgi:hypothetical protein
MRSTRATACAVAATTAGVLAVTGTTAVAAPGGNPGASTPPSGVQLEQLDRGLVAAHTSEGVFLSWRLLGDEVTGHTDSGMAGADFVVYRDGEAIATVTDSTNFVDPDGTGAAEYAVAPVADGVEGERSAAVAAWDAGYLDIPLNKPADGVTPAGESYTYSANDASVADLDGDGEYEIVLKWDPSNSKDVSQKGYTGNQYLDAYELDGTQLWRIDLGANIRAGAHYAQFPVYDFDGDGAAELMVKTFIHIPASDRKAGVKHTDDYRYSADDYYEHVVQMFRDWATYPEVTSGQWPATLEEAFGIEPRYEYPLSDADARELADHFMDVYAPARSGRNDLRTFEGFVISGPEYLTVFEGRSGRPLQTVDYKPAREDDGLRWGDYAMSRIEPGNRVDRFLSGVAYLDGERPSAVFARGYYTRTTIVAYDWDGKNLSERWYVDSGWTPMSNPFNDGPHGVDGTDPEFGSITTQGFHSLSAADVDGDGKQEIVYGAATIDDDGSLLYSSFDTMPEGSADPGGYARLGHGDAMHVTDIDPSRPGLEMWTCHEGGRWAPYGSVMRDAATGEVLFGAYSGRDTGRCMIAS